MVVFLHLQKMMSPSKVKYDMFNISSFTQEFICAGVRDNVVGMYNFLKEKGVQVNKLMILELAVEKVLCYFALTLTLVTHLE